MNRYVPVLQEEMIARANRLRISREWKRFPSLRHNLDSLFGRNSPWTWHENQQIDEMEHKRGNVQVCVYIGVSNKK